MSKVPCVLLMSYTLVNPNAVGVFFRAIRLAEEFRVRGWKSIIMNFGPEIDDPKVRCIGPGIEIRYVGAPESLWKAYRILRGPDVDAVVFGEAPFDGVMHLWWQAAALLGRPFFLLEQYYDLSTPGDFPVELMLLYGVKSFWKKHADTKFRWIMVSPFIGKVASAIDLHLPPPPHGSKRVTIFGFESIVLQRGLRLVAGLPDPRPQVVTVSSDPASAAQQMGEANLPLTHTIALPLQQDDYLYGLLEQSAAAIIGNGFMQMMESVALGCPAICIDRGIGLWISQLDPVFHPYLSFGAEPEEQGQILRRWLDQSPFDESLRMRLRSERNGATECIDHILKLVAQPPILRIRKRQISCWFSYLLQVIFSRAPHMATKEQKNETV